MLSAEQGVIPGSDFCARTPSAQASAMFLYPVSTGYFRYLLGHCLRRSFYDSFLVMYIQKGSCEIKAGGRICYAGSDQIVLLGCYEPHYYYTIIGWGAEWLHSDGSNAHSYFKAIVDSKNPMINLHDMYRLEKCLYRIYISFKDHISIKEALLDNYIVNILTELLISRDMEHPVNVFANIIEDTVTYINGHLAGPLMLGELASQASLNPFYFSRLFREEAGFTPYGYVITARVNNAKFLLKSSNATIKEICFGTGSTSESSLCITFKKVAGSTPPEYRERVCQWHRK